MDHSQHQQPETGDGKLFRAMWVLPAFIVVAAYFLITEHRAHLSGMLYSLPFLLLFACPLMHLFMHGGHGGHGSGGAHKDASAEKGNTQ